MIRFDNQFLKWLLIGAIAAAVTDAVLYPFELLIVAQRDAGGLPPTVALAIVAAASAVLGVIALLVIGERQWPAMAFAAIAAVVAYFIGATHLAALSIGVSVATVGDRAERTRRAAEAALARSEGAVNRAPVAPVEPRSASRRRRRRRR